MTRPGNGKRVVAANNKGQCYVWRLGGDDTSVFDAYTKVKPSSFFFELHFFYNFTARGA